MGKSFRLIVAAFVAALIAILLFLIIYNQIAPRPLLHQDPEEPGKIYFLDEPICKCPPIVASILFIPKPPSTDNTWTKNEKASPTPPQPLNTAPDPVNAEEGINADNLKYCDGSGKRLIDHIAPAYPQQCIDKGVEGVVLVEYDITKEGRVINIKIIETPDSCFNAAILSILANRKYPPMCDSYGKPVMRKSIREKFQFELSD